MKSSAKHVQLTSVDDLFTTEESRIDDQREKVMEIPLAELHPFENHPFKVLDDDRMLDTAQASENMEYWFPPSHDYERKEAMNWLQAIGAKGPVSLPDWKPCL